ncbi:MAG: 50S ribosomal protein L17 [Rhodothermales bacterium]|nr:50S ribosomal protein L17 [Rhodothermales bacterium]
MRHQHKGFKLGRTASHRAATLASMSTALIKHKRITTTHTKAKALRMYVEPIINRAKEDTSHNRRQVFRHLQDKEAVTELFGDVATRVGDRTGGYTRIVKMGRRAGDAAPMSIIELVDYNDVKPDGADGSSGQRRTRRGRRSRKKTGAAGAVAAAATTDVAEEVVDEAVDSTEEIADATSEAVESAEEAVETAEDTAADVDTVVEETVEEAAEEIEDTAEEGEDAAEADDSPDEDKSEEKQS